MEAAAPTEQPHQHREVDGSAFALITHWRLVVAELAERGVYMHSRAVLDMPWLDVRALVYSLLDSPTRLREVLTRR